MSRPREFDDQAVVDAAPAVFREKGYEGTSTQDLCERPGLGRGSLYNAFGSKHRLYEEAFRCYAEVPARAQLDLPAESESESDSASESWSVRERLRDLMLGVIEVDMADPGRRGCLALNAATEPGGRNEAVAALVHRQFVDLEQALCRLVAVGRATGELTAGRPPLQVARAFRSAYYGLRVLAKVTDELAIALTAVGNAGLLPCSPSWRPCRQT
ncbi:TetR/AcrR family transcriptional regulator [Embleya sp. NPDC008237]|uniref:TetR/AcrR family transcriptional regulator n=1 Tax=Embleya sp. NPDC008237 TaxID=3363978 RepID=UPI0036ED645A